MRLFPILAAGLVSLLIYATVFERARLMAVIAPQPTSGTAANSTQPETAAQTADTAAPKAAAQTPTKVVVRHSKAQAIDSAVILRGQTEAFRQVDVKAETAGRVTSEPLRKGSFVKTGQTLCRLDPGTRGATLAEARAQRTEAKTRVPEAQARLQEAQARLQEAEINNNAAAKLSADGFASEVRVASTKAAVSSAQAAVQTAKTGVQAAHSGIEAAGAAVAAAEEDIKRLDIAAPFAGLLESNTAELGSLLQPGALCATVIQLNPILLVGFLPETDLGRVAPGAKAGARLASGGEVRGAVSFLSRSADPSTRTFRVEVTVPNTDLALRDGQTAEIMIAAEGTQAHLLPQSALTLNDEGDLGVRIVTGTGDAPKIAEFRAVTLIRDTTRGVWVDGLPEAADVIIVGQDYVSDGVAVLPSYEDSGQ